MKLRVAWIIPGFFENENDYRGASAVYNLAEELSKNPDAELTIFTLYFPVNQQEYKFYNSVVFSSAFKNKMSKIDKLEAWLRLKKKFKWEHKKNKFDIIHALWAGEPGIIAARLAKSLGLPLAATICGGELADLPEINYGEQSKFFQKRFIDYALKHADRIISTSGYISEKLKQLYDDNIYQKSVDIPFGVDEEKFIPGQNDNRTPILINIANAVPVKSHVTLFKALKIVKEKFPEIKLEVYGNDSEDFLDQSVKKYDLSSNVILNRFVSYGDIPQKLNNADIFVLSSLYESQNMSIIEAAFCGLPVVSTNVGIASEVTEHLAKPGEYKELAEKILYLIENLQDERKKALQKRDELVRKFSKREAGKKVYEMYKGMIENAK